MPLSIVILEDNDDRRAEMERCLADRFPQYLRHYFATARETIGHLRAAGDDVLAISLDHDLEPILDAGAAGAPFAEPPPDPGTGREVVEYLVTRPPFCPVVVHSSNSHAAVGMMERLREFRWTARRVVPCDDLAWIPTDWFRTLRKAIVRAVAPPSDG